MEQMYADNGRALLGTSWKEFSSLVHDSFMVSLDNQPIPLPPPPDPAGLEQNIQPQPVPEHSQFGGYGPCYPGAYSQAQYLPNEWPLIGGPLPAAAAVSHPAAAPPHTYLPNTWPLIGGPLPAAAAISHPAAAPPHIYLPNEWPLIGGPLPAAAAVSHPAAAPPHTYLPYQWPVIGGPLPAAAAISHPAAAPPHTYLPYQWPVIGGPLPAAAAISHPAAAPPHTYLPNEWPLIGGPLPAAAAVSHPAAAPPHTYNNVPVVRLHSLQCVGMMDGEPLYALPAAVFPPPFVPAASQPSTFNSNEQKDDRPYVKRPPNAFMLYMKEHRPHVEEAIKKKGNGAVNTVLGQRWKSLSVDQQAVYHLQADRERELHALRNPGWSVSQNYGKKMRRERGTAPKAAVFPPPSVPAAPQPSAFNSKDGEPLYALPAAVFPPPSVPAAPQPSTFNSNEQKDDRPYVKRPPNAFMLYMKEHRPHVEEAIKKKGNGAVNTVLGQRWKSLSEDQQAVYHLQADRERELHALRNPGWSVSQNYGKKMRRERGTAPKGEDCHVSCDEN